MPTCNTIHVRPPDGADVNGINAADQTCLHGADKPYLVGIEQDAIQLSAPANPLVITLDAQPASRNFPTTPEPWNTRILEWWASQRQRAATAYRDIPGVLVPGVPQRPPIR
jgi:hypothetical protein